MNPPTPAKEYKFALVVPFVGNWTITGSCLLNIANKTKQPGQLIVIDNGSDENYKERIEALIISSPLDLVYIRNEENTGVLDTFKQGLEKSEAPITCFIHNDVLIHEANYDERITQAFDADPQLGLAGLFGARGVQPDGGREGSMSNMLGLEWGGCECHALAAAHHGEHMTGIFPCAVFDGVGLFFRTSVLKDLANHSDIFADWRAPHHFYDRIMSLKVLERGYHMAVIGIGFDHYSGATANHSQKYVDFARKWLAEHGHEENGVGLDNTIYWIAEKQWRDEYAHRLPVIVSTDYSVRWSG